MAVLLGDHLAAVEQSQKSVLNWEDPQANAQAAGSVLPTLADAKRDGGESSAELLKRFSRLVETMLARGHNLHDPRYVGHQVPASIPLAGWFDAVGSVTNQVGAIYEMGPWAAATEAAVVQALGEQIGLPAGEFAGVITHGGSLANLTALLTARNVTLGESWEKGVAASGRPPVLVAHAEAHYCIARSAGILGLGTEQVIRAELDERRRIDPEQLDEQLARLQKENRPVIAVVACACATPIGAFDPLPQIADVCQKHGVWLHVDAAHGGAACFSSRYRHLIAGLERADSFICDAHKMLFVPALCAFVFYRNKAHRFEAFRQDAPYLFDPSAPGLAEFDGGLMTVECTRRAAAYGLWGVWSLFGPQLFADMVDVTFDLGRRFYEMLADADDFQPLHEPECNIVVFRYTPRELDDASPERLGRFQLDLRRDVIESGESYLVPTQKDGVAALRVTIINPLTTISDLERLLQTLRDRGRHVLEVS
ncbi:MAG: aminotransferase class I/II-fold pyridoxal phosphate-dependent enzyme [Planctomycetes bacterium]|nr:aminotransferase class I/II-fold pyridoxal phosphate-dependent enzyme [Planctomycetota bacterium]